MKFEQDSPVKIRRIFIRNYKAIDELEMDFPAPRLSDDPDVIVMGSANGVGKTSVIECCALLQMATMLRERRFCLSNQNSVIDLPDLLIRAGAESVEIVGDIDMGKGLATVQMRLDRDGRVTLSGKNILERTRDNKRIDPEAGFNSLSNAICGFSSNPVIENTFLFFHSYRKVQEENPELRLMLRSENPRHRRGMGARNEPPPSTLKLQILRSLMQQAQLFEIDDEETSHEAINFLNKLVKTFAGGTISKLRASPDNTIDFRVAPARNGASFSFDSLGSGQKEIISTLFLIWYHSRNLPSVVLIDEPELHLNAQLHRVFMKELTNLVPNNQYIIATHSEDIMDSVVKNRRVLLTSDR